MITWEGTTTYVYKVTLRPKRVSLTPTFSAFQAGLYNGGPSGLVYGFLFSWVGSLLQALVMAEMASMSVTYRCTPPKWTLLTT